MGKRIIISENQYDRIFLTHNHNYLFEGDKLMDFDKDGDVDAYDVQQFLKNNGYYKGEIDGDFKDGSAKSFAKYHYGNNTKIVKELDFSWATDDIKKYEKHPILHMAGVTENLRDTKFYKGDYINKDPIEALNKNPRHFDYIDKNNNLFDTYIDRLH